MRASLRKSSLVGVAGALLALIGCGPGTTTDNDAAVVNDSGGLMCPQRGIPDPTNQTLPCCYRVSQADHLDMPELRLRYLHITSPAGSALVQSATQNLLNDSLTNETFNWLIRGTGPASGDGAITIETGFGTRDDATGTYSFSTMARYAPVTVTGTISGETVTTTPEMGTLVVPVFDPTGTMLQVELPLHDIAVVTSTFSENRSCIGSLAARGFNTAATLSGYLTVEDTTTTMINVDPIHAQLCTLLASSGFTEPTGGGHYCDAAQSTWHTQPDSLCATGATCVLDPGDGSVCSHDGTGATPCNAWQLVSDFAAVGVDITP